MIDIIKSARTNRNSTEHGIKKKKNMRKIILLAIALVAVAAICSCHNTKRQYYKMIDGIHDVLLEGT